MSHLSDHRDEFIQAACVPLDTGHASGTLDRALAILAEHPEVANCDIHTAAITGDDAAVRRFLAPHPTSATAKGGPRNWDPLTHLCFSKFLRLDGTRSDGFVRAAMALLDAGASANTGWFEENHQPQPVWESVLYGAAGIAHHAVLTALLLAHGADPNDDEVVYHSPEGYDNAALKVLVESGKLTADSLATMLLRKCDWHDLEGVRLLLAHGADPNRMTPWGKSAFHNGVLSDNSIEIIESLLDHGADPALVASRPDRWSPASQGASGIDIAARRGRGDVLASCQRRGIPIELAGVDRLIAACAAGDTVLARSIAESQPELVGEVVADGGRLLCQFAGVGNTDGVRLLLDLGVDVQAVFREGDGYFDVAPASMALHVAAWRARHATVKLLIERGSPVDAPDGQGRTPLQLAVKACVDSYWSARRSPESVEALLAAGASVRGVPFPCGYEEVDKLLAAYGATVENTTCG